MKAFVVALLLCSSLANAADRANEYSCFEKMQLQAFEFGEKISQTITYFGHFEMREAGSSESSSSDGAFLLLNNGKLIQITSRGEVLKCIRSTWDKDEFDFNKDAYQINIPHETGLLAAGVSKFRVNPRENQAPKIARCAAGTGDDSCWKEHVPSCLPVTKKDRETLTGNVIGMLVLKKLKSLNNSELNQIGGGKPVKTLDFVSNHCGSAAAKRMSAMSKRIIDERATGAKIQPIRMPANEP